MDILITGSVAYDYLMQFPGYFREHILPEKLDSISLSFLVESMVKRRGGTAPNIAYTLALLGQKPRVMATVGEDFEEYRGWLEEQGIDTRLMKIVPGEFTASFFCNTDRSNAQIASFYPGAMAHAAKLSFADMNGPRPDLVVISPNDPLAMNRHASECCQMGIPYIYDPSQQIVRLEANDLLAGITGARALFVNEYEFGLIEKVLGLRTEDILATADFVVVTLGEDGADVHTAGGTVHVPVVPPVVVADPTGVGDAFRGGFLTGYAQGFDWLICGEMGALAATYCLENFGTLSHTYSTAEFIERFRHHFDDQGRLNALIQGPR